MTRILIATLLAACVVLCAVPGLAQETPATIDTELDEQRTSRAEPREQKPREQKPREQKPREQKPREQAREKYLGRTVAKPMSHRGAPWLTRSDRNEEEHTNESFEQLRLEDGMAVCDLGCGNGFWTLKMAGKVGTEGTVYAVDIQYQMLQLLKKRAEQQRFENIEMVLGTVDDPKLPSAAIDLLLMVDVYHEFSHPESMLWEIRRSLKPGGVVALLEYREEDLSVPIKPLHKMSKKQIMREYEANGFKLVREYNGLPWQHMMFFARDDSPLDAIEPVPSDQVLKQLNRTAVSR